nr:hypothetical protein [Pelomonas sp. Root1217]
MPEAAIASACWRINCSLTLQSNLFHEFQPIGGVGATLGLGASSFSVPSAWAGVVAMKQSSATV